MCIFFFKKSNKNPSNIRIYMISARFICVAVSHIFFASGFIGLGWIGTFPVPFLCLFRVLFEFRTLIKFNVYFSNQLDFLLINGNDGRLFSLSLQRPFPHCFYCVLFERIRLYFLSLAVDRLFICHSMRVMCGVGRCITQTLCVGCFLFRVVAGFGMLPFVCCYYWWRLLNGGSAHYSSPFFHMKTDKIENRTM